MKILIGVPCGDSIKSRTAFSLINLIKEDATVVFEMGCDIAHNRNKLVKRALEEDYTHLLFIDADMMFNPDTLQKMLAHDKDILGCVYNKRRFPLESNTISLNPSAKNIPKTLHQVKAVGTGLMLIKADLFKRFGWQAFNFGYDEGERVGEDISFCLEARSYGYEVWVDPTIPARHIGDFLY